MRFFACVLLLVVFSICSAWPESRNAAKTFGTFASFGSTRVVTPTSSPDTTNSVQYVPLITILAGLLPNLLNKFSTFTGVNKAISTARSFDLSDSTMQSDTSQPAVQSVADNSVHNQQLEVDNGEMDTQEQEYPDNDQDKGTLTNEKELVQCDRHHIGLWPDKTNTQRYYKCELDPRTPPSADCIRQMFQRTPKLYDIPNVKPCFLLSLLQCANGFRYNSRRKVCMPDIVYTSRHGKQK